VKAQTTFASAIQTGDLLSVDSWGGGGWGVQVCCGERGGGGGVSFGERGGGGVFERGGGGVFWREGGEVWGRGVLERGVGWGEGSAGVFFLGGVQVYFGERGGQQ
jgi:hypothetical protein